MARFEPICEKVIVEKEGGYRVTSVEHDRGGQTCAGISRRANPDWQGWQLIDKGVAADDPRVMLLIHALYRHRYWDVVLGDEIHNEDVALLVFSCAVLSGARTSATLAQRACEATVDGFIGRETLKKMNAINPETFILRFTLYRINRYREIVQKDRSQGVFLLGWLNRAFGLWEDA